MSAATQAVRGRRLPIRRSMLLRASFTCIIYSFLFTVQVAINRAQFSFKKNSLEENLTMTHEPTVLMFSISFFFFLLDTAQTSMS